MSVWNAYANGVVSQTDNDTAMGPGITANGDYVLDRAGMDKSRPFTFGASVVGAGGTATVQLWMEVPTNIGGGTVSPRINLDAAQVVTLATPVAWPNEYTLTGRRGITVTGLTGSLYPVADQ